MRQYWAGAIGVAAAIMPLPAVAMAPDAAQLGAPIIVDGNTGPNMLGTIALPIRAVRFAESWQRADADATRTPHIQQMIAPARAMGRLQRVNFVQSAVHARIRWMSDATQWGQHDYWATAEQTLARGAGDIEDRAIVKMQALRALGFDRRDLFLTMGRDRVGGPITVLMVRIEDRYFMVDDTGGPATLLDRRGYEFQPQLTLGSAGSWVHARRIPAAKGATAKATVSAASASIGRN